MISLPGVPLKRDTKYQKEKKREKFRRRAAIEPIIGHMKSDHRMQRNYLVIEVNRQLEQNLKLYQYGTVHKKF